MFVDFKAAFNSPAKNLVLSILALDGDSVNVLKLTAAILQEKRVLIDNGVSEPPTFSRTIDVAKGDNFFFSQYYFRISRTRYVVKSNKSFLLCRQFSYLREQWLLYAPGPSQITLHLFWVTLGMTII